MTPFIPIMYTAKLVNRQGY